MAERKTGFSPSLIYFFVVYSVVAPFWIIRAVVKAVTRRESNWALERKA